ncbi:MAG: ADP compounds hydrolase NudE, partial [Gammaproteobacteria bacterium]|nr:ADP compounds hydrolase NudE [Gammaproteobacteria bacterium]
MKHPKILGTKFVASSRIFQIETVDLEFSNGELRTYECFYSQGYKQGAVMIVPVAADGQFVMVREYAAGIESYELSFPKGMIDAGETP